MDKKILLDSIIAVVILVLVSFTSVVGYNSVESNVKTSPLFKVRTNRAIGEESKVLTAKYVGKGTPLPFPERDDKAIMVQKVADSIRKINDKTFSKFVSQIILHLKYKEKMSDKETSEVLQALYYIRSNPNVMKYYDMKNSPIETLEWITCFGFPACIIRSVIEILIRTLTLILYIIFSGNLTCVLQCASRHCAI